MRTSLTEISTIDSFLAGTLAGDEQLIIRARMLIDPMFRIRVAAQKEVVRLSILYARQKRKSEHMQYCEAWLAQPEHIDLNESLKKLFNQSK